MAVFSYYGIILFAGRFCTLFIVYIESFALLYRTGFCFSTDAFIFLTVTYE